MKIRPARNQILQADREREIRSKRQKGRHNQSNIRYSKFCERSSKLLGPLCNRAVL